MNPPNQLNHEKLEVYQLIIQFLTLSVNVTQSIPRGNGEVKDQLKRSSISIVLNFAEGYGKSTRIDRARFYGISKASAHESAAALDICKITKIVTEDKFSRGKNLLYRIVCMLVKLENSQSFS